MSAKKEAPMLNVSGPGREQIAEARKAILDVLHAPCDTAAKVEALRVLPQLCGSTVSVAGCTFTREAK